MNPSRILRWAAATALAGSAIGSAWSQSPTTVRILVGFPAGGAPDIVARQLADQLRQHHQINAVVENRAGAAGKLAVDALLAAPADGQTVTVMPTSALMLVPLTVRAAAQYTAARDFVALGNLAEYGFGIAVGPGTPADKASTFSDWARANSAKANFATPGNGTPQHFLGVEYARLSNVPLTHVPYRGGANALTDVLGGQVAALITTEQLLIPHHARGKLKTLMVTSVQRNPKMPEVPTVRELGLQALEAQDWFGVFVRKGTPEQKQAEWRSLIERVVASPGYLRAIEEQGFKPPRSQAGLDARVAVEEQAWGDRARQAGFKATD